MSGFRETFTKSGRENVLGYDDSASLYFSGTVLFCVVIPWTYVFITNLIWPTKTRKSFKETAKKWVNCECSQCKERQRLRQGQSSIVKERILTFGFACQFLFLLFLWLCLFIVGKQLSKTSHISTFDPFEILEIATSASIKDVKKAYRTLSLKHHPDKNQGNPKAAAQFVLITKAYQSLTDEVAKANYAKYGNPDGPGFMKVGIGLPKFLIEKNNQLIILLFFFIVLLVVVPGLFICYYRQQKKFAPNGARLDTIELIGVCMKQSFKNRHLAELLAASFEAIESTSLKPTDNADMVSLIAAVDTSGSKRIFSQHPLVVKNHYLILGHLQLLHHLMSPSLKHDLDKLLQHTKLITLCMIEVAFYHNWVNTVQSIIHFRRCLIQAIDADANAASLQQVPHFDSNVIRHCLKGKNAVKDIKGFVMQPLEQRKGLIGMSPQQIMDITAFCNRVPLVKTSCSVGVLEENCIVEGDIVTLSVTLIREQLKENQLSGRVHSPHFPDEIFEEWWIFVVEKLSNKFITFKRSTNPSQTVEEQLQFQIHRKGKFVLHIMALCDSYLGLDVSTDIVLNVLSESEGEREILVHPDDEALGEDKTLFQQLLGTLNPVKSTKPSVRW